MDRGKVSKDENAAQMCSFGECLVVFASVYFPKCCPHSNPTTIKPEGKLHLQKQLYTTVHFVSVCPFNSEGLPTHFLCLRVIFI